MHLMMAYASRTKAMSKYSSINKILIKNIYQRVKIQAMVNSISTGNYQINPNLDHYFFMSS